MSETQFREHQLQNTLQTLLILLGMTLLLALLGFLFAGSAGLLMVSVLGLSYLLFTPNARLEVAMRMARAKRVHPSEAPGLTTMLRGLAKRASLPSVPSLYYIPSHSLNALAAGTPDRSAIAVTDGLLRSLNSRQILGVLAHEITHLKNNDLKVMMLAGTAHHMVNSFAFFGRFLLLIYGVMFLATGASIPWFLIGCLLSAPLVSHTLQLALSRTREFDADLGAARLTGDPEGLASALQRLENMQKGFLRRFFFPVKRQPDIPAWLRTHPDTKSRISRLLSFRSDQPILAYSPLQFEKRAPAKPIRIRFL